MISEIVQGMIAPVTALISEAIPDADKAADLAYKISTLAAEQSQQIALAQIEVNKAEAASTSLWTSGWRPAAGWVCVLAMFSNYVATPYLAPILMTLYHYPMPILAFSEMSPVLLGMLGLGGLRSHDKKHGVAS